MGPNDLKIDRNIYSFTPIFLPPRFNALSAVHSSRFSVDFRVYLGAASFERSDCLGSRWVELHCGYVGCYGLHEYVSTLIAPGSWDRYSRSNMSEMCYELPSLALQRFGPKQDTSIKLTFDSNDATAICCSLPHRAHDIHIKGIVFEISRLDLKRPCPLPLPP